MINCAINGFGRIGRNVLRYIIENKLSNVKVVAINDLTDPKSLAHLLKYDSILGILDAKIEAAEHGIKINNHLIQISSHRNLDDLEWGKHNVDVVLECTGKFTDANLAKTHIQKGAKKVIISAPAKHEDITVVIGVNEKEYKKDQHHIISNASCTTNCLAPLIKLLDEEFGFRRGLMNTIHSYTNDQPLLDQPHKDLRRSRAANLSMIPTTTGAAKAVGKVLPKVKGKITGLAVRVPTPNVSLVDLTAELDTVVSIDTLNQKIKKASEARYQHIIEYCDIPLVSVDMKKNSHSCIYDAPTALIADEKDEKSNLVKLLAWYDNEWGYSVRLVDLIRYIFK